MRTLLLMVVGLSACSLTPIPDLTSNWREGCDAGVRVCVTPFTLVATTERTVELRGNFRDGGWVSGEPMTRTDAGWFTSVPLTWGLPVQYKFFIDGSRWLNDPANPRVVSDGKGNNNSALDPVACDPWTCAVPAR